METPLHIAELEDHTCSVVQAGVQTTDKYGHANWNWDTPTATTTGIACHYSPGGVNEIEDARNAGTVIAHHTLWLRYANAPSSLLAVGAALNHRITTVKRTDTGASVDAGPFDIDEITDMAGIHQVLRLILRRVA